MLNWYNIWIHIFDWWIQVVTKLEIMSILWNTWIDFLLTVWYNTCLNLDMNTYNLIIHSSIFQKAIPKIIYVFFIIVIIFINKVMWVYSINTFVSWFFTLEVLEWPFVNMNIIFFSYYKQVVIIIDIIFFCLVQS